MPGGYRITTHRRSWLAGLAVILVLMTFGEIVGSTASEPADPILQLTPDENHYYLGPYLAFLEDPQKNLTIDDVSSPQMSTRFVRHAGKMINLGMDDSVYWIRFTVDAFQVQIHQKTWLLYFDWPNRIDHATLYIPRYPDAGWFTKEVGRILPTGLDPQPGTPNAFLPPEGFNEPVTFFLRLESESSEFKILKRISWISPAKASIVMKPAAVIMILSPLIQAKMNSSQLPSAMSRDMAFPRLC